MNPTTTSGSLVKQNMTAKNYRTQDYESRQLYHSQNQHQQGPKPCSRHADRERTNPRQQRLNKSDAQNTQSNTPRDRCRHCNPAPCMLACLSGAIFRDSEMETVMINPDTCINCASCAMACPYGVIPFHEDWVAPPGKTI